VLESLPKEVREFVEWVEDGEQDTAEDEDDEEE
jgi:hypothetical protein